MGRRWARCAGESAEERPPPHWNGLLARSRRALDELGLVVPEPFDLDAFVAEVERVRGRRLLLRKFRITPDRTTHCGYVVLLPRRDYDVVCYLDALSARSTVHNAVHELAHLLLGHSGVRVGVSAAAGAALATAGPEESEADALAAVVLGHWDARPPARWPSPAGTALAAARAREAFG